MRQTHSFKKKSNKNLITLSSMSRRSRLHTDEVESETTQEEEDCLSPLKSDVNISKHVDFDTDEETLYEKIFYFTLFLVGILLFMGAVYEHASTT